MEKKSIEINFREFDDLGELEETDRQLMEHAIRVWEKAYSPYSEFQVGAAVRMEDGKIIIGSNQENIAYPSGLCAERVALFSASAQYPERDMLAIAVYAKTKEKDDILSPCGACRQVMSEYEQKQGKKIRLIISDDKGKGMLFDSANQLLPFSFKLKRLKKQ